MRRIQRGDSLSNTKNKAAANPKVLEITVTPKQTEAQAKAIAAIDSAANAAFAMDAFHGNTVGSDVNIMALIESLRQSTDKASYGIFAGQATAWAVLRFTKHRAQWVEGELWHPQQMATREPDGSYLLKVPYSDDRELLGDILRFGADVQVLEPKELRSKVQKTLLEAVGRYV